ncbi:DNA-binding protein [Sporosarcina ureae]|uniref:DNA-binding protein n=1 Tax=Sporosarcina ureae TaxID=1571 RepID=UPI000A17A84E|nr:DNA-binding protein [Sporosarcina ureae]ARK21865.1 DNA-binding protein [Sporosarcina ureae]
MVKDLTSSNTARQNIINNEFAISEIEQSMGIKGVSFEGKIMFTKEMLAIFYDVDNRTIERYVASHSEELKNNGYELLRGKRLKNFMSAYSKDFGTDIHVGTKTTVLGVFDFRTLLNVGMLLVESENARVLRQTILDIVIDTINSKTGGSTKYINQRDRDFLGAFLQEENYRREFTDALNDCVDMNQYKYALYTDKIYTSIFKENAKEYREILKLKSKDRVRDTFYSEILDLVASYECGLAEKIRKEFDNKGALLTNWEVDKIFKDFEQQSHWIPLITSGRNKMASRDLALRDAFHQQLEEYVKPLPKDEYNRFLGTEALEIEKLMQENKDVLKRLKER